MGKHLFLLHETALGLALLKVKEAEEISKEGLQSSCKTLSRFQSICSLESFAPFQDQAQALESVTELADGHCPEHVVSFLRSSLPQVSDDKKRKKLRIGVCDAALGSSIKRALEVECRADELVFELLRGVRMHIDTMLEKTMDMRSADCAMARIGLGHSYSRGRVKFNVNRADNMIIQAIAMVDTVDKDLNTYCMKVREWYGWHFPEMSRAVSDQVLYAKIVNAIGNKRNLISSDKAEETRERLDAVTEGETTLCDQIVDLAKSSMGIDVSPIDIAQIRSFARRVISLAEFRQSVHEYLCSRMEQCAPNLTALIGEQVGARLISKAGSLIKLAKYPASTVQILGAEKALFRALKSHGKCNTPKYGLIFNSTFISRAETKDKGRISRYLANKAAMATRLDCFLDVPTNAFGLKFREQVEERLGFFKTGTVPKTNADAIAEVRRDLEAGVHDKDDDDVDMSSKSVEDTKVDASDDEDETMSSKKKKKKKKDKKDKKSKKDKKKKDKKKKKKDKSE